MNNIIDFSLIVFASLMATVVPLYFVLFYVLYLPIRACMMRNLALSCGLNYVQRGVDNKKTRNLITGKYKGREVFIYDFNGVPAAAITSENLTKRMTYINGCIVESFLFSYYSVNKIKKYLEGNLVLKDARIKSFNGSIFLVVSLLGIFLTVIFFNFYSDSLNQTVLYLISIIIFLSFIIIAYISAKLSKYKTPIG